MNLEDILPTLGGGQDKGSRTRAYFIYKEIHMNQLNQIIIEGNAVKEPTVKEPVPGFRVASFTIGANRYHKSNNGDLTEEVSYFDIECFNQMADRAVKEICKGRGIRIVGRLKQDRWKDNDEYHSRVFIIAEHIEYKPKPAQIPVEEEPQL